MQDSVVHTFCEEVKLWFIVIESRFFVSFLLKKKFKNIIPINEISTEA